MTYVLGLKTAPQSANRLLDIPDPGEEYFDLSKKLFGRSWKLTVGRPNTPERWSYTDLHINFNIEKTAESFANKARIEVYNIDLAQHTQNWKGMDVSLEVGYAKKLDRLFSGVITYVHQERRGADLVTVFDLGDGERSMYTTYVNTNYPALTPVSQVLLDLFAAMGTVAYLSESVNIKSVYNAGRVVTGSARRFIDEICASEGLEWSVQYGQAYVTAMGQPYGVKVVRRLSPGTGMLNSPIQGTSGSGIMRVTCLLDPNIQPGELINVESKNVSGVFIVRRCVYAGDTHSSKWTVECECLREKSVGVV